MKLQLTSRIVTDAICLVWLNELNREYEDHVNACSYILHNHQTASHYHAVVAMMFTKVCSPPYIADMHVVMSEWK